MSKYVIIDAEAIQQRIEELENYTYATQNIYLEGKNEGELQALSNLLSQSTPLIPEINAAIEFGKDIRGSNTFINTDENNTPFVDYFDTTIETNRYISNLKLDI